MGSTAYGSGSDRTSHLGRSTAGAVTDRASLVLAQSLSAFDDNARKSRIVRQIQRARRRRDMMFDASLFADPAWDMLLELYGSHLEQRRIAVSSLCAAAHVPPTTALRWISKLEQDGLASRRDDKNDGRRSWIDLTADGLDRMDRYFETRTVDPFIG